MRRAKRRQISITLGFIMFMGIAVYFRIWSIDYRYSSTDAELMRTQFDLANREAMDESAEWRQRYDLEIEKAAKCSIQLNEMKISISNSLKILKKDKMDLLVMVQSLKQELAAERLKCSRNG